MGSEYDECCAEQFERGRIKGIEQSLYLIRCQWALTEAGYHNASTPAMIERAFELLLNKKETENVKR